MTRHLFLTGPKHIGKSTVIDKLMASVSLTVGGFRTVHIDTILHDRFSVHMLRPDEKPAEENLLFICGEPSAETATRFDTLGCAALAQSVNAELILMDELGFLEAEAYRFQNAVLSALDGDIPILGVLQRTDSPFLRQVAAHKNATVIEVTLENRDTLPQILRHEFHF